MLQICHYGSTVYLIIRLLPVLAVFYYSSSTIISVHRIWARSRIECTLHVGGQVGPAAPERRSSFLLEMLPTPRLEELTEAHSRVEPWDATHVII